jgi:HEAT repeat protein
VVIRASSGRQIDSLLTDLSSAHALTRDGAVARLTVIGERAVPRLLTLVSSSATPADARVAALHALEGIGDPRAFDVAVGSLEGDEVRTAVAAIGVLQALLGSARGVEALDRLTSLAVDRTRSRAVRLAAIRALRDLGPSTIEPLLDVLGSDPEPAVVLAAGLSADAAIDPVYLLREAAEGTLPETPAPLRVALTEAADTVPAAVLQQLIERVRFREGAESGVLRAEWTALRAAAHGALAQRGSRAALYDLKETLESARDPVPVELLGAVAEIGDVSCLESIGSAMTHALGSGVRLDDWYLQRLIDVFRTIASREGVTKRTAVGRRLTTRFKEAAALLWP